MNEDEMSAEMRLAFTRAAVQFPRLDMHPVSVAVYRIFGQVFYELRMKHKGSIRWIDPYEENLNAVMSLLVDRAKRLMLPSGVAQEVTIGMPAIKAKTITQLVTGLSLTEARSLLGVVNMLKSPKEVKNHRDMMLRTHRNIAANKLVKEVIKEANAYFLGKENYESDSG